MSDRLTVEGMVLSAMPIGEYDKRITILTRERGLVSAFVRGARRPNSPNLAAANPFAYGSFELYEGRSSYTVAKTDIREYFRDLTMDLDLVYYGFYFLEVAEYYGQENMDERERLKLLYQTLKVMEKKVLSLPLIKFIYEFKTLVINGEYPNVFQCQVCGVETELHSFSMKYRGMVCDKCREKEGGQVLHPSSIYTLQYIVSTPVEKLYRFKLAPEVEKELVELLSAYRKRYFHHLYKSEEFLEKCPW